MRVAATRREETSLLEFSSHVQDTHELLKADEEEFRNIKDCGAAYLTAVM